MVVEAEGHPLGRDRGAEAGRLRARLRHVTGRRSGLRSDIARSRSFLGRFLLEADALPFVELLEVARLDRVAVEEPLLTALVLDEPETPIPHQTFDCSVRH